MLRTATFLALLAAAASAQWRGEARLDGGAWTVGGWTFEVQATGNHHYVLFDRIVIQSGPWETAFCASSDGGRTWTTPRPVLPINGWRKMAASGTSVVIAGQVYGPGGGHGGGSKQPDQLYADTSQDGGKTFQRTFLNTPQVLNVNYPPALAFDGNDVWLFWGEDSKFYLQLSRDRGTTWQPVPRPISDWMNPDTFLANQGRLFSLDKVLVGNDHHLLLKRSVNSGATWNTARVDAPTAHMIGTFRLARDGATLVAAWVEGLRNKQGTEAWVAVSNDHGATWTAPRRASVSTSRGVGQVRSLDLAISAGRILVVYDQTPSPGLNNTNVFASSSTNGGTTFTAARINSRPATNGYPMRSPVCSLAGERWVAARVDEWRNFPDKVVAASTSRDGGLTWSTDQQILTPDVFNPASIGHDAEGAVCVACTTSAGVRVNALHQPWLTRVGSYAPGQSVGYQIDGAEASDEGAFAVLALSVTGPGTVTGGIALPGGRRVLADADALTWAALQLGPLVIAGPINAGSARTASWKIPPGFSLGNLWAAAVVIRPTTVGSLTDPIKAN